MVTLAGSCRTREIAGEGRVELVWKLYGSRMGYHGKNLLRTSGREERHRDKKPNYVGGGGGGGGEAETESLILWLVVLELLAGGWWLHEPQGLIQGWLETHILYTWL